MPLQNVVRPPCVPQPHDIKGVSALSGVHGAAAHAACVAQVDVLFVAAKGDGGVSLILPTICCLHVACAQYGGGVYRIYRPS